MDDLVVYILINVFQSRLDYERVMVDRKLVKEPPPSNFIAGRLKAALLFWFVCDYRCDVCYLSLFML